VHVGVVCRGEEGGATGGGEGRPVAAAPRDDEVEGEAAAAKAEGRNCSRPSAARGRGVRVRVRVGEGSRNYPINLPLIKLISAN